MNPVAYCRLFFYSRSYEPRGNKREQAMRRFESGGPVLIFSKCYVDIAFRKAPYVTFHAPTRLLFCQTGRNAGNTPKENVNRKRSEKNNYGN